jgi:hypothetical protein
VVERENGTRKVSLNFSKTTSKVNPEFQRECDIHNIIKLPLSEQPIMSYGDVTDLPSLRDVFRTVHDVKSNFMKIPSDVRKLMDNDPANLHSFLTNPKNKDLLISKGVLKAPKKEVIPSPDAKSGTSEE